MYRKIGTTTAGATFFVSTALGALSLGMSSAGAGMTDQGTGERCLGTGCMEDGDELPIQTDPNTGPPPVYLPPNVTTEGCSSADSRRIGNAVTWLKNNIPAISAKMAESSYLMSWPGNTREKFEEKLDKDLEFHCISQKNKCDDLLGVTYPVFAQQRVNLCSAENRRQRWRRRGQDRRPLHPGRRPRDRPPHPHQHPPGRLHHALHRRQLLRRAGLRRRVRLPRRAVQPPELRRRLPGAEPPGVRSGGQAEQHGPADPGAEVGGSARLGGRAPYRANFGPGYRIRFRKDAARR